MKEQDMVLVTDWEKVDVGDDYLSMTWLKSEGKTAKEAREIKQMAKDGQLYYGYLVGAVSYAVLWQMDASQVLIDHDATVWVRCESTIIGRNHTHRESFEY